jgi:hypothetical protein
MRVLLIKLGVLFALLLITPSSFLSASPNLNPSTSQSNIPKKLNINSRFVLEGKRLIDPRTINKIDEMGTELFDKTGVSVYIYAKERYLTHEIKDIKEKVNFIKEYEANITKDLKEPFVLISISVEDTHLNILKSKDVIIDKDDILDTYIIPVLASKDKNSLYNKVTLAMLNGYAAVTDNIASSKGLVLESSIESGSSEFKAIWRVFMYFLVVIGLLAYVYAILKSKKSS